MINVTEGNSATVPGATSTKMNNHSELKALLSIRKFSAGLADHKEQFANIENGLPEWRKNSLALACIGIAPDKKETWESVVNNINSAVLEIIKLLNSASQNVEFKARVDTSWLWQEFGPRMEKLRELCKIMDELGFEILPENERPLRKANPLNFQESVLPLLDSHATAYKMELQMIEKYTPAELSKVTQLILDKIPENFTFEEAEKYERDYLKAMGELEKELHEEKNLWDTFLDILAGGSHQTPSERVMLNRWIEGEKGDL